MTNNRPSFLLYKSFYAPVKHLKDDELGLLFRALFDYQNGVEIINLPPQVGMAFAFFKNQFDLDEQKYQTVLERNKSNGSKGGRPKKEETQANPENPVGFYEPRKGEKEKEKENGIDKEIQEEQELKKKLLKSQFEKIYKLYNQGKNIKVIPFEKLKAKFQNCLKEITFEELEQNIKDYLQYLSTAEWRKKKAFDAWINSPEFYANDWINEGSDNKTTKDGFCQSLNKLLEQDLIEKLIENQDAVTIKLFSASSYDKWEVIDSRKKNKIKELLNAKFNKKITIKF